MMSFLDQFDAFKEKRGLLLACVAGGLTLIGGGFFAIAPFVMDSKNADANIQTRDLVSEIRDLIAEGVALNQIEQRNEGQTSAEHTDRESLAEEVSEKTGVQLSFGGAREPVMSSDSIGKAREQREALTARDSGTLMEEPIVAANQAAAAHLSDLTTGKADQDRFSVFPGDHFELCGFDQFIAEFGSDRIYMRNLNRTVAFKDPDQFRGWDANLEIATLTEIFPGCKVKITPDKSEGARFMAVYVEFTRSNATGRF